MRARITGAASTSKPQDKDAPDTVDHQTKVALKNDEFVTTTTHGLAWVGENRRSVIVTVAILLAVILVAVLGTVIYNNRAEAASTAFGAAMQAYQTPLAQPGQPVPPGVKTYASVAERAKAANDLFMGVARQYGMTPDGKVALYFAGLTYIEQGQNQSAEDALKKVAGGWNSDLAGLAKFALAQLYRQTGRDPQAIEIYNGLSAKPTTTVPYGLAQLQLAELYESEGKADAAKKIYAALKDKDKDAKGTPGPAATIAEDKLNPKAAARPAAQ